MDHRFASDAADGGVVSLPRQPDALSLHLRRVPRRKLLKNATCLIYAIGSTPASGFVWRWRAGDGSERSRSTFHHFYLCMADARAHGYAVNLPGTICALKKDGVTPERTASAAPRLRQKTTSRIGPSCGHNR
jgi:hypothetical protein